MAEEKRGALHWIQEKVFDPGKGLFVHKVFWLMTLRPVSAVIWLNK